MATKQKGSSNGVKQVEAPANGAPQLEIRNPVTQELIGYVPIHNAEEVRAAAERARAAQPAWEARSAKERAYMLRCWGDLLWQKRAELMRIIRSETGKNETGAFLEVYGVHTAALWLYHNAPRILRPQNRMPLIPVIQRAKVYFKPHGVVGCITPWNYPLYNGFIDLIPALVAGNSIVVKPSELSPFTTQFCVDLMVQAGIPKEVVQMVTGDGSTGAAVIDNVDYVSFTGSTATGRKVAERAAKRLIQYTLELGGKDPMIVLEDANLELAASGTIRSALENSGQACVSTERVYVTAPIYDKYIERLMFYARQIKIGAGDGFDVDMGSMTHEREVKRVEAHIKDAVEKGAELVYGGQRRPDLGPLFIEPTILTGVTHDMDVMREETFGPVIAIMKVKDADEAVRMANDSEYGLSGAIFTRNLARGEQLARMLRNGDIGINRTYAVAGSHALPWGGRKESGLGRRGGPEGLLRYVQPQSILIDTTIGAIPGLTLLDTLTFNTLLVLRVLRRYIPFL
ncbi:MAG: aldehyde dehydrogenase family protein [Chloroflexi bacterium]|nr:aldehyde dehydrogenase family protein [Chloroflexota bacterium]